MLIVIEGPDASGKTTLAKYIAQKLNKIYVHFSGHKSLHTGMYAYHDSILKMIEWNTQFLKKEFVLDRSWISELIYGTIFRPDLQLDFDFIEMVTRYEKLNAHYVICGDDQIVDRYLKNVDSDHPYTVDEFRKIVEGYKSIETILQLRKLPCIRYQLTMPGGEDAIIKALSK